MIPAPMGPTSLMRSSVLAGGYGATYLAGWSTWGAGAGPVAPHLLAPPKATLTPSRSSARTAAPLAFIRATPLLPGIVAGTVLEGGPDVQRLRA